MCVCACLCVFVCVTILFLFSVLSLIFCRPGTCASHLATPFPNFHGFSPSPLSSRLDKPALLFRFCDNSATFSSFEKSLRLPSDFLRPTKALLNCFRSYWAFASSSPHADGLALQLTPRSLNIAFSDVRWPPLGSVNA